MAPVLNDTERKLRRTPLYNDIGLPRRFAWHDRRNDTFTVDGYIMTRSQFTLRWGLPGESMDLIAWDPYD